MTLATASGVSVQVPTTPIQLPTKGNVNTIINTGTVPVQISTYPTGSGLESTSTLVLQGGASYVWTQSTAWAMATAANAQLYIAPGNIPYFNPNQTIAGPVFDNVILLGTFFDATPTNHTVQLPIQEGYNFLVILFSGTGIAGSQTYSALIEPTAGPVNALFTTQFLEGYGLAEMLIFPLVSYIPGGTIVTVPNFSPVGSGCNINYYAMKTLPPGMRQDGRMPPRGTRSANQSTATSVNLINAPSGTERIMLLSLQVVPPSAGTTASFAVVNGTSFNVTGNILEAICGNATSADRPTVTMVWPNGNLMDVATPVTLAATVGTSGTGQATATAVYDVVT